MTDITNKTTNINGLMIQYYHICHRKLWLFSNKIQFENINKTTDIQIGKTIQEEYYQCNNKKQRTIDNVINIDMISDWNTLHEIKKTNKNELSTIYQLKYYMYYLQKKGIPIEQGIINYPLLKKIKKVKLTNDDIIYLESIINDITNIINLEYTPKPNKNKSFCKQCAYFDFCFS